MESGVGVEEGVMKAPPVTRRLRRAVNCGGRLCGEGVGVNFDFLALSIGVDDFCALPSMQLRCSRRRRRLRHIERGRHLPRLDMNGPEG